MTDEDRLADPGPLLSALPPGSVIVQRNRDPETCLVRARALVAPAGAFGHIVLAAVGTPPRTQEGFGIHIPEKALSRWSRVALHRLHAPVVSASAHTRFALWQASRAGVDFAVLSPVLPTTSHPGAQSLGLMRFAAIVRASPIPVYALGGITLRDIRRLRAVGARGIAGISLFVD